MELKSKAVRRSGASLSAAEGADAAGPASAGLRAGLALLLALAAVAAAAVLALRHAGFTPGQVLDHLDVRLQGHPTAQAVALPALALVRRALDEPPLAVRRATPFVVPPPPRRVSEPPAAPAVPEVAVPGARIVRVGPDQAIRSVAEAARLARDGDTVEIAGGEYRADVAVWLQKRLVIRATGGTVRLHADGVLAEGKAIWVLRGGEFDVSGIEFVGARATDRNGAGIRIESGRLRVRDCLFWGSDSGIMTGKTAGRGVERVEIERSEFGYLGHGDGQSHHVYVEASELFRVTGSYFHHGNVGHLIKSRSAVNDIRYNRITDERGGRAAYEIDLPNGGIAVLVGNVLQQNRETENPALISYGREGWKWPVNRLFLVNNTLVNEHPYGGAFLRAAPGSDGVYAANNLLVGIGRYHVPEGVQAGHDVRGALDWFYDAAAYDYRLSGPGRDAVAMRLPFVGPDALPLVPVAEYVHPLRVRALDGPVRHSGAMQRAAQ
jgi:hypothetical protein